MTTITDADVVQAQHEADEAAALAALLEERVRDGDQDVTHDQISAQRSAAEFAQLRVEATRRRLQEAKTAARLADLDALRNEIQGYQEGDGEHLTKAAHKVVAVLGSFVDLIRDRNQRIDDWHARIKALRVPEHNNPLVPPAAHGQLGHGQSHPVIAGDRRMKRLDEAWLLTLVVHAYALDAGIGQLRPSGGKMADVEQLLSQIETVAAPDPNLRFFLTEGGGVLEFDREPNEFEKRGLKREITREEAWGQ